MNEHSFILHNSCYNNKHYSTPDNIHFWAETAYVWLHSVAVSLYFSNRHDIWWAASHSKSKIAPKREALSPIQFNKWRVRFQNLLSEKLKIKTSNRTQKLIQYNFDTIPKGVTCILWSWQKQAKHDELHSTFLQALFLHSKMHLAYFGIGPWKNIFFSSLHLYLFSKLLLGRCTYNRWMVLMTEWWEYWQRKSHKLKNCVVPFAQVWIPKVPSSWNY